MTDELNQFATSAAQSLHPKSKESDDLQIIDQAIKRMMGLNAAQRSRVQQMMLDAYKKSGAFSSELHRPYRDGAKNFDKEDFLWPTVSEFLTQDALKEQLDEIGFTEQAREKAVQLFEQAVEQRLENDDYSFRQSIGKLLADFCPSPFINDEELDVVELLAHKINELEEAIACVKQESYQLANEILENLEEENNERPSKSPKRSTINENMMEPHEENENALFNANHQYNLQMARYLKAMGGEDLDE